VLEIVERKIKTNPEVGGYFLRTVKRGENVDIDSSQDVGLAREAAYNLSLIYVTTGASTLAEDLYRRWLTL
jgi:general transcription factor 3C polypeptide 3 (transcription factor C subunit 4)